MNNMKNFARTLAGKSILYVLSVLFFTIFVFSCVAVFGLMEKDAFIYTHTEEEVKNEILGDDLQKCAYGVITDSLLGKGAPKDDHGLVYYIVGDSGKILYKTNGIDENSDWDYMFYYVEMNPYGKATDAATYISDEYPETGKYKAYVSVADRVSRFSVEESLIHIAYRLRYMIYAIGFVGLILFITSFIMLLSAAGRRRGTEEIVPGPLNIVPYDVLLTAGVFLTISGFCLLTNINLFESFRVALGVAWGVIITGVVFVGLSMSAAVRIKQKKLIKGTAICFILKTIWKALKLLWKGIKAVFGFIASIIRSIPMLWKTALLCGVIATVEFVACALGVRSHNRFDVFLAFLFIEKIVLFVGVLYIAACLKRIQAGGKALASGDLSHVTDTKGMFLDIKEHADNLNGIAVGMAIAVEDRTKSEKMKAQLVTNVSHDIKTPLTSIINYTGIIENELKANESISESDESRAKILEYSQILTKQSERLKRLLEDLIEASKASSGNLEINPAPCNAGMFISQAVGEYEEKLLASQLSLIVSQPEKEIRIMADGRRMWRIFDNLMNNICKYSLPGTRVYLSLEELNGRAVITFRNTSREALNMSEEELMERFARGDSSRNTEGNGLGLSIAKSMAQLQGGELTIKIDADLFKAILSFPIIGA